MARKLIVEICNAKNLMPKDGQGTASAYAIVDFYGQRRRTKTRFRDLNPEWDEKLEFLIHDPDAAPGDDSSLAGETLEINLYNDNKKSAAAGKRPAFLGKVKIAGSGFCKAGEDALVYYPLEKRSVFSQVKGEIGVKVYYVEEDPPSEKAEPTKEEKEVEKKQEEQEEKKDESSAPAAAEVVKEVEEKTDSAPPAAEDGVKKPPEDAPPPAAEMENTPLAQSEVALAKKDKLPSGEISSIKKADLSISKMELRSVAGDRGRGGHDLVDMMPFLYVRVVKAKSSADKVSFAKLAIGTHTVKTRSNSQGEWDQAFAFDKEGINSSSLEVSLWCEKEETIKKEDDKEEVVKTENCVGMVSFDLTEVPKRVPPDSPLAPQWYGLEADSQGNDIMLAVWFGTQADEAFQEAWQSDSGGLIPETRAKVYLSPKLWYLRLTVIQTQDLQLISSAEPKGRVSGSELYVKGQLGPQVFKTGRVSSDSNPSWNEDLVFVAAEPFEPILVVTVEDSTVGKPVGSAKVHMANIERRNDDREEPKSRWFNLEGPEDGKPYAGRIHVRVCLEGGYHVLDEAAHVTSDVRPSAKQLSRPPIGLLEVGIRGANNLLPVKTKQEDGRCGTTDSYVLAKYGPKWVRTRTILDRFNPRWNEQYTWDVYDPCTVLVIGVFDNGRYKKDEAGKPGRDVQVGKIRIRLSTLDTNRVYLNSYPLTVILPSGAKRMGDIEIAVRFSCTSWLSLIQAYSTPVLPRMHYVRPMGPAQQDILRHTAMRIVTIRLARSEPPLGQEVVQSLMDSDSHVWSMRRSKANWFRVVSCLSRAVSFFRWADEVRTWAHPPTTVIVHVLLVVIVLCPHLVLPTLFMYAFLIMVLRFRYRGRGPASVDPRLSYVDVVGPDELDEEFDGFPTSRSPDVVRIRYDRLRALAGRAQTLLGDVAAQGERVEALFNWKDPRATGIFAGVCLIASLMFYAVPFKIIVLGSGLYYLRHPRFRGDMPSIPISFFRRLPSLSEQVL